MNYEAGQTPAVATLRHDPAVPRRALVTGGAKRIGREIVRRLAADGFDVAIHYRASEDEAVELAQEVEDYHRRSAIVVKADLDDPAAAADMIRQAELGIGPLGVLVNNASIFDGGDWDAFDLAELEAHFRTNLFSPLLLTQAFAKHLPEGARGVAINLIDQRVWNLTPHFIAYTASKSALWTATRTMALALAPKVRVNAIGPGPVLPSPRQDSEDFDKQWRTLPLRRRTQPSEIADAVAFLVAATAITGQMLALDSGEHLGWRQDADGIYVPE